MGQRCCQLAVLHCAAIPKPVEISGGRITATGSDRMHSRRPLDPTGKLFRMTDAFYADTDRFPHETIDGETVLIDSKTGNLFLFTGTGPSLWDRFGAGGTISGVVAESTARYGASAAAPTRQFLEQLAQAHMLCPGGPPSAPAEDVDPVEWPADFEAPVVERYEEMSDIINMDPIHDVDQDKGWPRRPDGSA